MPNVSPRLPWNHPTIVARFLLKLRPVPGSECVEFTGMRHRGWGRMVAWEFPECPSGRVIAHRYAFAIFRGPLIPGITLNHTCRRRACVNPYHLEQLSRVDHGYKSYEDTWSPKDPGGDIPF